jgi:hypothetical protein
MTFFEICLDEISYYTPYLQDCNEKKKCLKFFFLEKSPVQPLVIGIEDGTGKIQVVLARCQNLECSSVKELYPKCAINTYVHVIGMVKDDFNLRTIIVSDVRPVSTGNELTYHLLEVAYSTDKVMTRQMEEKLDAELIAVDLNHVICEYHLAIDKKRKAIRLIDVHNNNSLTAIDAHERQHLNELRGTVISCRIFIRS